MWRHIFKTSWRSLWKQKEFTHWLPDEEPYFCIKHQVKRDLDLVRSIGAVCKDDHLRLSYPSLAWARVKKKLDASHLNRQSPWIILHPGVSEVRREVPSDYWIETGRRIKEIGLDLIVTGNSTQRNKVEEICHLIGRGAFPMAGLLQFDEFVALIDHSFLVVSVNTVTIHIAAATNTPVVVLYALTNPQHTPWRGDSKILTFHPPNETRSKNTVVRYVYETFLKDVPDNVDPDRIMKAVIDLLEEQRNGDVKY